MSKRRRKSEEATKKKPTSSISEPFYLQELADAILALHGVFSSHLESVPIKEVFSGQTVWEGNVEVFDLEKHPEIDVGTDKAYAWVYETATGGKRTVVVLGISPVDSPQAAVQAAIVKGVRDIAKAKKSR